MMLKDISSQELIKELAERNLLTSAANNKKILFDISQNPEMEVGIILSRGIDPRPKECSRCRKTFPGAEFPYYAGRVSKDGYRQRTNAVCKRCTKKSKKELDNAVKKIKIPPKPEPGTDCDDCERPWTGNWHRHHQGDKFLGWICGQCNMSKSDHRNEHVKKRN